VRAVAKSDGATREAADATAMLSGSMGSGVTMAEDGSVWSGPWVLDFGPKSWCRVGPQQSQSRAGPGEAGAGPTRPGEARVGLGRVQRGLVDLEL
jgi:hypothetical protein